MNTSKTFKASFRSFARSLIALTIVLLGITGIAAIVSDSELSLDYVFGHHTWLVWLGTTLFLLALLTAVVARLAKPIIGQDKSNRFRYSHC